MNRETVGSKVGESVFAISLRLNTIILCNSNVWIQTGLVEIETVLSPLYTFGIINHAKFKPNFIDMDIGTANSEHFSKMNVCSMLKISVIIYS